MFLSRANRGSKSTRGWEGFVFLSNVPAPRPDRVSLHPSKQHFSLPFLLQWERLYRTQCHVMQLLKEESKGGMGLKSTWMSRPRGHFVFTHGGPLRDESVPPTPRGYSTGCLHVLSWKLPSSLAESTCRRRAGSTQLQGLGFRSSPVVRHHLAWLHLGSKVAGVFESKL